MTGLGLDEFPKDIVDQIMATRGFAQPFIDAIVADQDKPQVANST